MRIATLSLLFMLMLSIVSPALAATQYVSDELLVMLRSGESEKHKILKMLKSGTPLEVLQEGDEYFLVRAPDQTEGYVLKQFLTTETPKPLVIGRLEREKENLKNQLKQLQAQQAELSSTLSSRQQEQSTVEAARAQMERDLTALQAEYNSLQEKSANVIELSQERDRLEEQNSQLTGEVGSLREDMDDMLYSGAIRWFLAGGGVFLTGWLIGKTSRKKKKGYSL